MTLPLHRPHCAPIVSFIVAAGPAWGRKHMTEWKRLGRRPLVLSGAATLVGAHRSSHAQGPVLTRPVEIVVPYAAGGPADRYVRAMADPLRAAWGQPIVISNKPGGGATIGAAAVAKAPPDGQTLLMASFGLVGNRLLMRELPYDPGSLAPLSLAGVGGMTLYTRRSLHAPDLESFLNVARTQPGGLRFGSSGVGSTPHVACEVFAARVGVEIIHVPYRGSGQALTDLLAGNIDAVFTATTSGPARSDALVAIASSGTRRSLITPQVPTLTESGLDVVARTWYGFLAPSATPPSVRADLVRGFQSLSGSAEARNALIEDDIEPLFTGPDAFARFLEEEMRYWAPVFRERNIQL
ncbi:Bug family tripartite tricarboxylate transporter substrate binding protein [Muricoccus radiodurans]|uniref:Bug family tripartite tricarboxylate transporter substrate binding protein n=1 Tax=Muricoccus radiodurans TaxID=2231721 RepID=UPI003CEF38D0